jgi:uracil-DNA glycosylase
LSSWVRTRTTERGRRKVSPSRSRRGSSHHPKIRKELERDPEVAPPEGGNLEGWARQGVLLLNTVLTVRAGAPNSHRVRGWEDFTDAVISAVNKKSDRVVFLLWGAAAQKKAGLVTNETHRVIRAAHPVARASAHNPLVTSGSFSCANKALVEAGRPEIKWDRSAAGRDPLTGR